MWNSWWLCEHFFHLRCLSYTCISRASTPTKEASNRFREVGDNLKCRIAFCEAIFEGLASFISHLKDHVKWGTPVDCLFASCTKHFIKLPSFSVYLSRNHEDWSIDSLWTYYVAEMNDVQISSPSNVSCNEIAIVDAIDILERVEDDGMNTDESGENDSFTERYSAVIGRFYRMLQALTIAEFLLVLIRNIRN